jgi:glutaredoxin
MAINLLDEKELSYKTLLLDQDFSREEFYQMVPGAKTFPQILVNGKTIGGYEELAAEIDNLI